MSKEKLDALLESGSITQEEYDDLLAKYGLGEDPKPDDDPDPDDELDEKLEKLVQAKVDKITAKIGKEKADIEKKYKKLQADKLTEDELKKLEDKEREENLAERERVIADKESRLYAIKAIKKAGLDDGSDNSLQLVEFVLDEDTAEIDKKVKAFGDLVKKFVQGEVDKTFKENGRTPNSGKKGGSGVNPYAKETYNLTEQMRLEVENPELASTLKAAAGLK